MQPRLLGVTGSLTGGVWQVPEDGLEIGTGDRADLRLAEEDGVSVQCRVEVVAGQYRATDRSGGGMLVNGSPVKECYLEHGDALKLGGAEFLYLVHEGEETAPETKTRPEPGTAEQHGTDPGLFSIQIGRMARDLVALFRISSVINSIRDCDTLQRELMSLVGEVIPAEYGAVLLVSSGEPGTERVCRWSREPGREQFPIRREYVQKALWERSQISSRVETGDAHQEHVLCVPLTAIERVVGVLYLGSAGGEELLREDHQYFLDSVSRIAAVTLENMLALDDLRRENRKLKQELAPVVEMVGESRAMTQVESFIARVAKSDTTVLIRGESGTGKEVVARSVHAVSPRADRPFVAINCAAIPETLIESELFGNEKGAYTGASAQRKGRFEVADDGTIFLDEVGELPLAMQAKLLRVLQQREFERVGGSKTLPMRARVLAATNRNLEEAIKSGEFRQDLYYRLNVVSVSVPPLRKHREDIPLLALHFARKHVAKANRPFKGISPEARTLLLNYDWPGNVRELENAIEHAIVLGLTDEILAEDLPAVILEQQAASLGGARYYDAVNAKKKELILGSLAEARGNFPEAARLLGIHPKYLHRLARNLNLKEGLAREQG